LDQAYPARSFIGPVFLLLLSKVAMKRPASSKATGRAKKSKGNDSVASVVDVIKSTDVLPVAHNAFFVSMLPHALNTCKADRPPFETELVNKAEKVLSDIKAGIEESLKKALKTQGELTSDKERQTREATKAKASKDLDNAVQTLEAAKEAKATAQTALADAKVLQKTTAKDLANFQAQVQKLTQVKATLEKAVKEDFVLLKEEGCVTPVGKKALKSILMLAMEHSFDQSLFGSFPVACQKGPDARTEFEAVVFTDVQAIIDKELDVFAQKIAAAQPVEAEKHTAATQAEAGLSAAKASLTAAEDHFEKSSGAISSLQKSVRATSTFLRGIWYDMKAACEYADGLADELSAVNEVMASFQKLKEKVPEPDPPPVVAEAEAPAAMVDPYAA